MDSLSFPYKLPSQFIIFTPKRERGGEPKDKNGENSKLSHMDYFSANCSSMDYNKQDKLGLTGFNTISTDLSMWWFFYSLTLICFITAVYFQI